MSDLLDITSRVCANQNSAETVRFGRETYSLHSHADCGTPIYKRVYNGSCNRGGGSPWFSDMVEFKTLSACKEYLAYYAQGMVAVCDLENQ